MTWLLKCNLLFKLHFTKSFINIYLNSKSPAMWAALLCEILCKVNNISDISLPLRAWIFSFSGVVGMLLLYFPVFGISKKYIKWRTLMVRSKRSQVTHFESRLAELVYFDQCSGARHSEHWSKIVLSVFHKFLKDINAK